MLSITVKTDSNDISVNDLSFIPPGLCDSQWEEIVQFLELARKGCTQPFGGLEARGGFMKNFNHIKNCILNGIETGEFDPQYSVDSISGMIVTFFEGLRMIDEEAITFEIQIRDIKSQLKEILLVL